MCHSVTWNSAALFSTKISSKKIPRKSVASEAGLQQGCQMLNVQTKNRNLGKFWMILQLKVCIFNGTYGLFYCHLI
jgi:hypothetical protein